MVFLFSCLEFVFEVIILWKLDIVLYVIVMNSKGIRLGELIVVWVLNVGVVMFGSEKKIVLYSKKSFINNCILLMKLWGCNNIYIGSKDVMVV